MQITLFFAHNRRRTITTSKRRVTILTPLPERVLLVALRRARRDGGSITLTKLKETVG